MSGEVFLRSRAGQVTLFVIIGIVIVVGVLLFFVLRDDGASANVPLDMVDIKAFVDSCIEGAVYNNSYLIGENGGYIDVPDEIAGEMGGVYYFYRGRMFMPDMDKIKEELIKGVERDVLSCVGDFENFAPKEVREGDIEIDVEILDDEILYDVKYPLVVRVGEDISRFSDFGQYSVKVGLGSIYLVVEKLIRERSYEPGRICASCFADAAVNNDLAIDLYRINENYSVFLFRDSEASLNASVGYPEVLGENGDDRIFKYVFASDY